MSGIVGNGFMGRGGIDPCAYVPGLYTQAEVDDLINIDGYIPVADAVEFNKISTGAVETMGGCSIWAGSYTTGTDKKYVQIKSITLSVGYLTIIPSSGLIYDGNNFALGDVDKRVFASTTTGVELKNIRLFVIPGSAILQGVLTNLNLGGLIDNCIVDGILTGMSGTTNGLMCANNGDAANPGTIRNSSVNGSITGAIAASGLFIGNATGIIEDCTATGSINSTTNGGSIGGFFGLSNNNLTIRRCWADVTVNGGRNTGGFFGNIATSGKTTLIEECYSLGQVTGVDGVVSITGGFGGITRFTSVTIRNSFARGNVIGQGARSAGFVCDAYNVLTLENCYCANTVTGATNSSGFTAFTQAGTTASQCYFDETVKGDDVNGGVGDAQTTAALQTPTSNTGIYSAWDAAIWDFGTSTDYPELINTP